MKSLRIIVDGTWEKLLALCGALCVLLPTSPWNMPFTFKDSGVFLYFGWRILNGELPYRDMWDHKPPVIFYVNALGLAFADNSRWGVWLIELAALFFAAFLGYQLIKKLFGLFPAIFSLLLWLLSLVPLLQGGNFTTEYTLPLQFAALWLIHHADGSKHPDRDLFLIGLTGAIAFFMKQTAVGIWIAIVIYLTLQRILSKQGGQWMREMSFILLGGATFSAIVIIFFAIQGGLPQFWNAAFEYNFIYAGRINNNLMSTLDTIAKGIRPLTRVGLFQLAVVGCATAVIQLLFRKRSMSSALPLLTIGLVNLPIELALIGMPGRTYPHYYMTLLPVLAIFTGLTVWGILSLMPKWEIPNGLKFALAAGIAGVFMWNSFDNYMNQLYVYRKLTKNETVVGYIVEHTSPDDQVLLWGAETSVNYFAQRKNPTRFVYQYPLHQEGYVDEVMINQFLDEIIQNRPKFIIDTGTQDPMYGFAITTESINKKIAYLETHYCVGQRIDSWIVYEYSEEECPP